MRLLSQHPAVQLTYLGGDSSAGKAYADIYPHLAGQTDLTVEAVDADTIAERCEVVFLSLPNGLACQLAPALLAKGCRVLDLSADYRFSDLETYQRWYGTEREDLDTAAEAVYGLPELYRDRIAGARLIGCPGCYPTASLLGLAPLLKQGLAQPETLIIDAKSGTSGGGRAAKTHLLLAEASNSLGAYGVAHHRHTPEIEQTCSVFGPPRGDGAVYPPPDSHGAGYSFHHLCHPAGSGAGARRLAHHLHRLLPRLPLGHGAAQRRAAPNQVGLGHQPLLYRR